MAQQHYKSPLEKALLQFIAEPDPYLAMLKWVMTEMMRIEAEAKVGAAKGKHSSERATYFSGARARRVDTRMGTVYLLVPKVRKGGYVPFFVSERRRSEQALIAVVQEAFVNGVSTRKIERLAHAMGIENISASQVSEFNKELDAQVEDFKARPLAEEYPFLWIDALYQKVRVEGRVISVAVMIACGVNPAGSREILAVEPMFDESEDSWRVFFRKLKARGMKRTALVISDAHAGIQAAARKEWLGASWQRCKVHFMRNILAKVPHREKSRFAAHLKQIWLEPDKKSARRAAAALIDDYEKRFPDAIRCLEEGLEDSLSFYDFPEVDKKRISSTNGQERLNMEIRRRSRVVGVFPSVESYVRLTICYLIEYSEDWANERSYIREDKALWSLDRLHELTAQAAN
ncbi:MAG TPA: IS256 family transposase [Candidatus Aminicenantes bacterium]|nr:IS256 family transposase [Candidatus Aminicenantes bacterium]HRY66355.1 IS256 family transposase [Candidatus Aminicenantes bacterium]HRZ72598.1 IS256 family transposase [Candidatus Aminicenantes bacterium]